MFTAIIWDFDGTLFDTYPGMVQAFQKALRDYGLEEEQDGILKRMKISVSHAINEYKEMHNLDGQELAERYRFHEAAVHEKEMRPYPHAAEVCERFKRRGGRNFIFTHRGNSVFRYLKYHNMLDCFDEVVTKNHGYRKPDAAGFLYFTEKYRLEKEKILVVGDRDIEIVGAYHAGMKSCLFNSYRIPYTREPDYIIESLEELYALINV